MSCIFCGIVAGSIPAEIIWQDAKAIAFLDNRPLFKGHVLLSPSAHVVTLDALPADQLGSFFRMAQRLQLAVEEATGAEGTFLAINNRVSQSVPHLHLHIVPRRKGDGLKGFFWPRHPYESESELKSVADRIRECLRP